MQKDGHRDREHTVGIEFIFQNQFWHFRLKKWRLMVHNNVFDHTVTCEILHVVQVIERTEWIIFASHLYGWVNHFNHNPTVVWVYTASKAMDAPMISLSSPHSERKNISQRSELHPADHKAFLLRWKLTLFVYYICVASEILYLSNEAKKRAWYTNASN